MGRRIRSRDPDQYPHCPGRPGQVTEVASYEHSRIHGVSNLNATRDGWRVLRTIIAERTYYYRRRRKAQGKHAPEAPAA